MDMALSNQHIAYIPAFWAASTPEGASSNTKTFSGMVGASWKRVYLSPTESPWFLSLIIYKEQLTSNLLAATRKISGAGFPSFTAESSPTTTWFIRRKSSLWFVVLSSKWRLWELHDTSQMKAEIVRNLMTSEGFCTQIKKCLLKLQRLALPCCNCHRDLMSM